MSAVVTGGAWWLDLACAEASERGQVLLYDGAELTPVPVPRTALDVAAEETRLTGRRHVAVPRAGGEWASVEQSGGRAA